MNRVKECLSPGAHGQLHCYCCLHIAQNQAQCSLNSTGVHEPVEQLSAIDSSLATTPMILVSAQLRNPKEDDTHP